MTEGRTIRPASPRGDRGWAYLLAVVPALTDLIETGRPPRAPREWVTEVVVGCMILLLVHRVRRSRAILLAMARSDALTGLLNRRAFEEAVADECHRARRAGRPLSLAFIDLDNFKRLNDHDGHAAGDEALRQLARAMLGTLRAGVDRACRIGGDEFALLLPGSDAVQAEAVVARLRQRCGELGSPWRGGPLGISAGVVELAEGEAATALVQRADEAMYRIKQEARRRAASDR